MKYFTKNISDDVLRLRFLESFSGYKHGMFLPDGSTQSRRRSLSKLQKEEEVSALVGPLPGADKEMQTNQTNHRRCSLYV